MPKKIYDNTGLDPQGPPTFSVKTCLLFIMNSGVCGFCCGHSSFYEFSVGFPRRRGACLLGFNSHGYSLQLCNCTDFCTDFCSFVLCRLPNDILLLVNTAIVCTTSFKLSFLVAFMSISILIDCSFHSCCPCAHCFSHHYSVACSASIVVVVPSLDTRH